MSRRLLLIISICLGLVAMPAELAAGETLVSGAESHDAPLVIDPVTAAETEPLTTGASAWQGATVAFIQDMPSAKLITEVTLGDLKRQEGCGAAAYMLKITQSPGGAADPEKASTSTEWTVNSTEAVELPSEFGKATWEIPPTMFRAGMGYTFWVKSNETGCGDIYMHTWDHNEPVVNHGSESCDAVGDGTYRMWHEAGESDGVACPASTGEVPNYFDPAMPTGWLKIGLFRGYPYVETFSNAFGQTDCLSANLGVKGEFWKAGSGSAEEFTCVWTRFSGAKDPEPEEGWYYAWGGRQLQSGTPQDMYLSLSLDPADSALYYKPDLFFDTSESWRPLDLESFFSERYFYGGGSEIVPAHNLCLEGIPEFPAPIAPGCSGVESPEDLMAEGADSEEAILDVQSFGRNTAVEEYVAPGCDPEEELLDCDPGESAVYWRVTPGDPSSGPSTPGEGPYRYLQYWMFYRLNSFLDNDSEPYSRHEGDWEAVAIAPSRDTPGAFDFASFSQHGSWYSYLRENLSCSNFLVTSYCGSEEKKWVGAPLDVYIANGSHANYAETCSENIPLSICGQNTGPLPERGHDGAVPWERNEEGDAGLRELPGLGSWTYWNGHWGASDSSPESPGRQSTFFDQSWGECAEGNEECPTPLGAESPRSARRGLGRSQAVARRLIAGPFPGACRSWFGGGVAALLCAPQALSSAVDRASLGVAGGADLQVLRREPLARRLNRQNSADTSPGLVQVTGPALRPGDALEASVPPGSSWDLYLRVFRRGHIAEAKFSEVKFSRARVGVVDGEPVLRAGRVVFPDRIQGGRLPVAS